MDNKLFLSTGFLGRRNFIINYLYIQIIIAVISSIYSWLSFFLILFFPSIVKTLPFKYLPDELLALVSSIFEVILLYSSVKRRVADIIGEDNQNKLWIYAGFYNLVAIFLFSYIPKLINSYIVEFNFGIMVLISICFITFLFLFCKKGKLSSKEEPNPIIKFNWGACIGTWIWGLFNSVKKTLLMIILFFVGSGAGFNFALICGIKGNEWVKESKKDLSNKELHSQQQKQTKIMCILIPLIIAIIFTCIVQIVRNQNCYNFFTTNMEKTIKIIAKNTTYAVFDKVEYSDNEYKFYLNINDWNNMSNTDKTELFEMAVYRVLSDKNLPCLESIPVEIINNTIFYDSENGRYILGCNVPEEYGKNISVRNYYHRNIIKTHLHN